MFKDHSSAYETENTSLQNFLNDNLSRVNNEPIPIYVNTKFYICNNKSNLNSAITDIKNNKEFNNFRIFKIHKNIFLCFKFYNFVLNMKKEQEHNEHLIMVKEHNEHLIMDNEEDYETDATEEDILYPTLNSDLTKNNNKYNTASFISNTSNIGSKMIWQGSDVKASERYYLSVKDATNAVGYRYNKSNMYNYLKNKDELYLIILCPANIQLSV